MSKALSAEKIQGMLFMGVDLTVFVILKTDGKKIQKARAIMNHLGITERQAYNIINRFEKEGVIKLTYKEWRKVFKREECAGSPEDGENTRRNFIVHKPTDDMKYLCNQAVTPNPFKIARIKGQVNCKNCLRILKKRNPDKELCGKCGHTFDQHYTPDGGQTTCCNFCNCDDFIETEKYKKEIKKCFYCGGEAMGTDSVGHPICDLRRRYNKGLTGGAPR